VGVSILIPKFNLVTWASLTAFFGLCLFEGGEPNPELSHAVLGLIALGAVAAAGVKAAWDKNKRQKEAIAATADFEAGRKQDITDAYKASVDPAQARLTKDDYGPSDASMRDQHEDVARAVAAQDRFDRAALEQERQGPYGPGTQFDVADQLAERRLNTLASSKLGIQRGGDMAGAQAKASDVQLTTSYGNVLGGLGSNVANMQYNTPGMWERLSPWAAQTGTALAKGGYLSGKDSSTAGSGGVNTQPMTDHGTDAAPVG
tara:strand:+ start:8294 stop:9073 length:780 start_codon:yes stop_codon:yes gene_type:complete